MRTIVSFVATPRLPNWQSDLNPANRWFRSLFWERTVSSLLAKVEALPPDLQGEIATRVGNYIDLARTAQDDDALTCFVKAAARERENVAQAAKSETNPLWTAAALSEAWCVSRLGLSNGTLNRLSAMSVSTSVEAFASGAGRRSILER
jgi:hypothetical protein